MNYEQRTFAQVIQARRKHEANMRGRAMHASKPSEKRVLGLDYGYTPHIPWYVRLWRWFTGRK